MLRREAEQACDDLVVCATGRSEAYARGLAHVAERAVHLNPLIRRIPTMNAFAAESDLALRIRRTLGGNARRMGMRARVLAAVLLCPLAAVTLPSVSKISAESSQDERPFILVKQDKPVTFATLKEELQAKRRLLSGQDERLFIVVDQDGNMKLNDKPVTFATLKEELQAKRRLLDNNTMLIIQGDERSTHEQIAQIMNIARQVGLVDQVIATEPQPTKDKGAAESSQDDDNLAAENLFIDVDQDGNMKLKTDKSVTFATLKEELQAKRQLLDNNTMLIIQGDERSTHGQVAQIMDIARQVGLVDQVIATEPQPAKGKGEAKPSQDDGIWLKAMSTDPDDWSDELKTQLLILKPGSTIEEIAEKIRKRRLWEKHVPRTLEENRFWRQAMETDPDEWSDKLKAQLMFESGSTIEEIAEKIRKRRLWREAKETYPDDWSEELKAQLLTLKTDSLSYEIIAIAESAELVVYSPMGELVRTFVLGPQNPGKYHIVWDGRDDAGRELGSGVYFYRLKTNPEEASDWRIAGRTILVR